MLKSFHAAPHRMMFAAGSIQLILTMIWWLLVLLDQLTSSSAVDALPAPVSVIHGWLLLFGLFPFFISGFLLTVFPRWLSLDAVKPVWYQCACYLMSAGQVLIWLCLYGVLSVWLLAGMLMAAGWGLVLFVLCRLLMQTQSDRRHATAVLVAVMLGWLMMLLSLYGGVRQQTEWMYWAVQGAVWLFLFPLFVTVSHRMIPFFTETALKISIPRSFVALWWLLPGSVLHFVFLFFNITPALMLIDGVMAVLLLSCSRRWQSWRSLKQPLLAVLHISFLWAALAMCLYCLFYAGQWLGVRLMSVMLPLHALMLGFFVSMMIGFVTRVTLGHSGQGLRVDRITQAIFVLVQLMVLLRLSTEALSGSVQLAGYMAVVVFWLMIMSAWLWKYLPTYFRSRVDGKPG